MKTRRVERSAGQLVSWVHAMVLDLKASPNPENQWIIVDVFTNQDIVMSLKDLSPLSYWKQPYLFLVGTELPRRDFYLVWQAPKIEGSHSLWLQKAPWSIFLSHLVGAT